MSDRGGSPAVRVAAFGIAAGLLLSFSVGLMPAGAAARSCDDVVNPYEGTRYDGIDLTRIRADGVHCAKARRVARRAHRKALALVPDPKGFLRLRWNGWKVIGDLRPSSDRFVAKRHGNRVRWRF